MTHFVSGKKGDDASATGHVQHSLVWLKGRGVDEGMGKRGVVVSTSVVFWGASLKLRSDSVLVCYWHREARGGGLR